MDSTHSRDIVNLLADHYKMYNRSKISLSQQQIIEFIEKENCVGIGIYTNLQLTGILFSRPLGFLMLGQKSLDTQKIGLIDFFCVHEKHRRSGIGSKLLHAMAYECFTRGYVAHLFLKEGMPLTSLPPLYSSHYVWRPVKNPAPVNLLNFIRSSSELPQHSPFWNSPDHVHHTKIFECFAFTPSVFVGVTNLFHTVEPDKKTMGEISWVWYNKSKGHHSDEKLVRAVETVVDSFSSYDILIMDSAIPHDSSIWTTDALFSYYCWNLHPGTFFKTRPVLTF